MSSPIDRFISVTVTFKASQPEVLEGLDVWLRLGLLTHEQVRYLSQKHLSCLIPEPVAVPTPSVTASAELEFPEEFPEQIAVSRKPAPKVSKQRPNVLAGMLGSLMAELSVRWLLFLGVFMVVVSSGVLAASQWENFPAAGQYGVLLAYTLIFWGVSFWAGKQPNLRLTAQTLLIVTLLLVPVNFWAMDSFGLWQNPVDWVTVAVATLALTAVTILLFTNLLPRSQPSRGKLPSLPVLNILGLSYLHWGWKLAGFPLIAVYLGMVGTTVATVYQVRRRQRREAQEILPNPPSVLPNLPAAVLVYALAVLLVRAIFVVQVEIAQLGLAIGICGWLITWLSQQQPVVSRQSDEESTAEPADLSTQNTQPSTYPSGRTSSNNLQPLTPAKTNVPPQFSWEMLGGGLLFIGWLVSVGTEVPWQATVVSGLILWFFAQRLQRLWLRVDLLALFVVGLQSFFLVWRLIPQPIQTGLVSTLTQLTNSQSVPWALLSLALFPYVVVMVGVTDWLYRRSKPDLALFGEQLTLIFGTFLTFISLVNPPLRSLNLLFSTLTLAFVTQRRSIRVSLVYLTHIAGLLTFCSVIDQLWPYLSAERWASILLVVMVAEWAFSIQTWHTNRVAAENVPTTDHPLPTTPYPVWQQSAWHIGLGLAGLSYSLLWVNTPFFTLSEDISPQLWGIVWLITPLALTGVASQSAQPRRKLTSWLSVAALGMAQLLTITLPGARLIGLGVATALMLVNTRYLRQLIAAVITVGLGLSFITVLLWDGIPGLPLLSTEGWLLVGAMTLSCLWIGRGWLVQRQGSLPALYATAADDWAVLLCGVELWVLMIHLTGANWVDRSPSLVFVATPLLIMVATAYRSWQQPRQPSVTWWSILALSAAQVPLLDVPGARLIGLGVATGLMLINTHSLQQLSSAVITVGFGLSFWGMLLWEGIPGLPQLSPLGWFVIGAVTITSLWLLRGQLRTRSHKLPQIYAQAADNWAIGLCSVELLLLTLHSLGVYWTLFSANVTVLVAVALTMVGVAYRSWQEPNNWAFYGMGWGLELLTAEALGFVDRSVTNLAIANIALGLTTQLLGELWRRHHRLERVPSSWHILPLVYGVLGAFLRWGTFTSWTGLCSFGIALIAIGVGRRRQEFKPLLYLGLIGVSVSAYELLFYQLSQMSGGALGDGLVAMAALGTSIMYVYRLLSPWLISYLKLTPQELKAVAHLHWAWSSCLLMAAIPIPIETSRLVGLGTGIFLVQYAIFQGRVSPLDPPLPRGRWGVNTAEIWVYLGLLEFVGLRIFWSHTAVGRFWSGPLVSWKAPIACVIGYFLYILPWESWGWSKRPWRIAACIWPLVMLWETRDIIEPVGLLITAGYYVFLATIANRIRFTYISIALVNWALTHWLISLGLTDPLWYVTLVGLSLLYVAQFDPSLQQPSQKQTRHFLRLLGTGTICGWALLFHQETGLQPGILSLVAIFAGLALRVRAFLYVGTAVFLLTGFYQLVIFIFRYPFFKWIIGLLVGIGLISIAANFETRRDQLSSLLRHQLSEFQEWD